jgi:hypothetical protein
MWRTRKHYVLYCTVLYCTVREIEYVDQKTLRTVLYCPVREIEYVTRYNFVLSIPICSLIPPITATITIVITESVRFGLI